jgi:hypothetical protein
MHPTIPEWEQLDMHRQAVGRAARAMKVQEEELRRHGYDFDGRPIPKAIAPSSSAQTFNPFGPQPRGAALPLGNRVDNSPVPGLYESVHTKPLLDDPTIVRGAPSRFTLVGRNADPAIETRPQQPTQAASASAELPSSAEVMAAKGAAMPGVQAMVDEIFQTKKPTSASPAAPAPIAPKNDTKPKYATAFGTPSVFDFAAEAFATNPKITRKRDDTTAGYALAGPFARPKNALPSSAEVMAAKGAAMPGVSGMVENIFRKRKREPYQAVADQFNPFATEQPRRRRTEVLAE